MKIYIYKGSNRSFNIFLELKKCLKWEELPTMIMKNDGYNQFVRDNKIATIEQLPEVENIIFASDHYSFINEHVIFNMDWHIKNSLKANNLYIQNPPKYLDEMLNRNHSDKIEMEIEVYNKLNNKSIKILQNNLFKNIKGQEKAINQILDYLAYSTISKSSKPLKLLFYGPTGVGKTETVKLISKALNGSLFRKQMSMYQNQSDSNYIFGGRHCEASFAKDLIERETNIILLDEFDKLNPYFHNIFYQFFDEGLFIDKNYHIEFKNTIIICTSNYDSIEEVKKHLGDPIFSRFDACIQFLPLSKEVIMEITNQTIEEEHKILTNSQKIYINIDEIKLKFEGQYHRISNVRSIKNLVKGQFATKIKEFILK